MKIPITLTRGWVRTRYLSSHQFMNRLLVLPTHVSSPPHDCPAAPSRVLSTLAYFPVPAFFSTHARASSCSGERFALSPDVIPFMPLIVPAEITNTPDGKSVLCAIANDTFYLPRLETSLSDFQNNVPNVVSWEDVQQAQEGRMVGLHQPLSSKTYHSQNIPHCPRSAPVI